MDFPTSWAEAYAILQLPILNGVSFILTVLFGLMSWVFYQRQKQIKDFWYYVEDYNVGVAHLPPNEVFTSDMGLSGTVEGDEDYTHAFRVIIWNRGKSTIERNAITSADPLVISAGENHEIVTARVISESRKAVSASVEVAKDKASAHLSFSFLDWRDGFEVDIQAKRKKDAPPDKLMTKVQIGPVSFQKQRKFSLVQVSGTVIGVAQMNRLRDIPGSESIAMLVVGGSLLTCLISGLMFSIGHVFSFQWASYIASSFVAPAFVFCVACAFSWLAIWLWHFRFLPSKSNWFRHENPHLRLHAARRLREKRAQLAGEVSSAE